MDRLDRSFGSDLDHPTRRALLRCGVACGAACLLGGSAPAQAQDVAGGKAEVQDDIPEKGIVRHPARHWDKHSDLEIECTLCPRGCVIGDVERGYCGVRENVAGAYQTLVYGALCSAHVDPIEKKPLFHYLPGTTAFSVATAGCNIECKFCQNWRISQYRPEQVRSRNVTPERLVAACKHRGSPTIAYTYSEPVVFYEYMYDSAAIARAEGIGSVMISNGYIRQRPLRELCQHLTAVKIDLKAFSESFYHDWCAGSLKPVLTSLEVLKEEGIWFELVILIIPTLNDDAGEIKRMADWVVAHLGPDVPMHFTRFHPTYRVTNLPRTPVDTLVTCRQIALDAGVHYAYAGNVPMHPGENTYCHSCGDALIERVGFRVTTNSIDNGHCPKCRTKVPGIWSQEQALSARSATPQTSTGTSPGR